MADEIENQNVIRASATKDIVAHGMVWVARVGPDDERGVEAHGIDPVNAICALALRLHHGGYVFDSTPAPSQFDAAKDRINERQVEKRVDAAIERSQSPDATPAA